MTSIWGLIECLLEKKILSSPNQMDKPRDCKKFRPVQKILGILESDRRYQEDSLRQAYNLWEEADASRPKLNCHIGTRSARAIASH